MDEKTLIKSNRYNVGKGLLTFFAIFASIFLLSAIFIDEFFWWSCVFALVGVAGLICLVIYIWMRCFEIVITDKRVYGQTSFGKRVDLPIDSISAIASRWPKGVAVATSSGKVAFLMIKNRDEIHKCVSNLLIDRQNKTPISPMIRQEIPQSNADELKKFKELLDSGVITQEEFDAKKKQLLGL